MPNEFKAKNGVIAPTLISTVTTGTAPLTVASTTKVTNLNADLLDGLDVHTSTNNEVNKIVRTDVNGYIQAGWINTASGDNGTTAIDRVYASSDGYIRYYTPTNFRTVLNVPTRTGGDASGSWNISVTGNAATVTNGVYTTGDQTITGIKRFEATNTGIANVNGDLARLEARGTGGAAFMQFHRPSAYAAYFGIDSDNVWKVGGWSMGANAYPILHSNNYNTYALGLFGTSLSIADWNSLTAFGSRRTGPDGADVNGPPINMYGNLLAFGGDNGVTQLQAGHDGRLAWRTKWNASDWTAWSVALDSNNYNSYVPTLTGTGASGSWGINVTGSAATLTTARTINGTSFNGSAAITTASWGTARTLTVGATGKSVDGSANVSWTTEEILPARLRAVAASISDWNTATENGWYQGASTTNAPNADWHLGFVEAHIPEWVTQTVHGFSNDDASDGKLWRRHRNAGTWLPWYRLRWTEAEQDARYAQVNGTGASGNWSINVTGNAATVTNGLYSNSDQTITTGFKRFQASDTSIANASGNLSTLEVRGAGGSTGAAFMTFHRPGVYAAYFGIDTDNVWKVGGWSAGAVAYPILHSNNFNSYALPLTGGALSGNLTVTGNVGIGTTSVGTGTKLNVAGRGLFTGGSYDPFDSTASGVSISYDTVNNIGIIGAVQTGISEREMRLRGNSLSFYTNGANERMRIQADGRVSISNNVPATTSVLRLARGMDGSTFSAGISVDSVVQNGVTSRADYMQSVMTTAAGATYGLVVGFQAQQSTLSGAVSNLVGFRADASLVGGTANYGFFGDIPSGANRWNLYMSGTAHNYLAGPLAIGAPSVSEFNRINIAGSYGSVASSNYSAIYFRSTVQAAAAGSNIQAFLSFPATESAAFNLNSVIHFDAAGMQFNGAATATEQVGFRAPFGLGSSTASVTTYGFQGALASGTNRWNLYMSGTAANHFAGDLLIGQTSNANSSKVVVNGTLEATAIRLLGSPGGLGGTVRYIAGAATSTDWYHNVPTGGVHYWAINESERMRLVSSGINVVGTKYVLSPLSAEFPTSNTAALAVINERPALAFDTTTAESVYWTVIAPQAISGNLSLVVSYKMASATSGGIVFSSQIEAVTSGDAVDLDATTSFDTVNTGPAETVPATAGHMKQFTITLTNRDSYAEGDYLRISLKRETANASDTAAGDCYVLGAELRRVV